MDSSQKGRIIIAGVTPEGFIPIYLGPFSLAQFTGTDEKQGAQLQSVSTHDEPIFHVYS